MTLQRDLNDAIVEAVRCAGKPREEFDRAAAWVYQLEDLTQLHRPLSARFIGDVQYAGCPA